MHSIDTKKYSNARNHISLLSQLAYTYIIFLLKTILEWQLKILVVDPSYN